MTKKTEKKETCRCLSLTLEGEDRLGKEIAKKRGGVPIAPRKGEKEKI